MAIKYRMEPKLLDRLLKTAGLARKDIQVNPIIGAEKSNSGRQIKLLDRKVVQSMNEGKEHTLRKFQQVADLMKIPVETLLPELAPEPKIISFLELFEPFEIIDASEVSGFNFKYLFRGQKISFELEVKNMSDNKLAIISDLDASIQKYQTGVERVAKDSLTAQINEYKQNDELNKLFNRLDAENLGVYYANWEIWEESDDFYNRLEKIFNSTKCLLIAITDKHRAVKFEAPLGDVNETPTIDFIRKRKKEIFEVKGYDGVFLNDRYFTAEDFE